jgi:hypothetical protein
MKDFKKILFVLVFISAWMLSGCNEGDKNSSPSGLGLSGPSSGSSSSGNGNLSGGSLDNSKYSLNGSNSLHSANSTGVLTSFTLWTAQDDVNTAIAGEIIGNSNNDSKINVQVPADTPDTATFYITTTGVDNMTINGSSVTDNSAYSFVLSDQYDCVVTKGGTSQKYTLSFVRMASYFSLYPDKSGKCVKDFDGNVWVSAPDANHIYSWNSATTHTFSVDNCGFTSGWQLPDAQHAQVLLNKVPLKYRAKPDGGTGTSLPIYWLNSQTEFGLPLFKLPAFPGAWYWLSDPQDQNQASVIDITTGGNVSSVRSLPKSPTLSLIWPVHKGDINDAKTITGFTIDKQIGNATIVGNQIFATVGMGLMSVNLTITTGGTVTINDTLYVNNNLLELPELTSLSPQMIPITVTSKNGDKNIYTLVLMGSPLAVFDVTFTQFSVSDTVSGKMVDGVIDNSNHTITVNLSDGANLCAAIKYATSGAAILVNATDGRGVESPVQSGNAVYFNNQHGDNVPLVLALTDPSSGNHIDYKVTVNSNPIDTCNCTPFPNWNMCGCPAHRGVLDPSATSVLHRLSCYYYDGKNILTNVDTWHDVGVTAATEFSGEQTMWLQFTNWDPTTSHYYGYRVWCGPPGSPP